TLLLLSEQPHNSKVADNTAIIFFISLQSFLSLYYCIIVAFFNTTLYKIPVSAVPLTVISESVEVFSIPVESSSSTLISSSQSSSDSGLITILTLPESVSEVLFSLPVTCTNSPLYTLFAFSSFST